LCDILITIKVHKLVKIW